MNFTVGTKPLQDGLNLGIVNANITKFFSKSMMAQVTASKSSLRINLEVSSILSEIRLKGVGDSDGKAIVLVDSLLLKQLVSTLNAPQITFEFKKHALILHCANSKFTLPQMVDASEMQLNAPASIDRNMNSIDIVKNDWRFIKDHQMYAIAKSYTHPVYTMVWIGAAGDVLVGDYVNSLFTHSRVSRFGKTCLLSDTIINLFNALPDGAKLIQLENNYVAAVKTDGFEFVSEFTPKYESAEVGNYNSEIILRMMHPNIDVISKVSASAVKLVLNQAALLCAGKEPRIKVTVAAGQITFKDENVDCTVSAEGGPETEYTLEFKPALLSSAISSNSDELISISPTMNGHEIVGFIISSNNLNTVLAGVE